MPPLLGFSHLSSSSLRRSNLLSGSLLSRSLLPGSLERWLGLEPLVVDSPGTSEKVPILIRQELPINSVEKPLESPQVSSPLHRPTLQTHHDWAVQHGKKVGITIKAEGPQSVKAVDHVHRVVAGAHHVGGLALLVLGEVIADIAAPAHLPLHVGDSVL